MTNAAQSQGGAARRGGVHAVASAARLFAAAPLRRRIAHAFGRLAPKRLYARSLLIVVMPIVILQSVLVFVFMERHWQLVTNRLSAAVSADVAALVSLHEALSDKDAEALIARVARDDLELQVDMLPPGPLPPVQPKPFFSILDEALSRGIALRVNRPFWIDTVGRSSIVEIRVKLDKGIMRVFARRSQAYASNSHIFLVWMACTSLVLIGIAILFLRNQIRPILQLADAAESFGKGRDVGNFHPRGALEVRKAALAFLDMRARIERQIEQRTAMLAGVSHDLRTVLTRFRLQLALLGDGPDIELLVEDVDEMSRMLDAYLAFARGDAGEQPQPTDVGKLLEELKRDAERAGHATEIVFDGSPVATLRPDAFKRCLSNLVANAIRFGDRIVITARRDERRLVVIIDDDGPGIPEDKLDEVFRPFYRLDDGRNLDHAGTGLGLAIARDIARGHGGDVTLDRSPLGGLRATVRIPL